MKATILNDVKNLKEVVRVREEIQDIDGVNEWGLFTFDIEVKGQIKTYKAHPDEWAKDESEYLLNDVYLLRIWGYR